MFHNRNLWIPNICLKIGDLRYPFLGPKSGRKELRRSNVVIIKETRRGSSVKGWVRDFS